MNRSSKLWGPVMLAAMGQWSCINIDRRPQTDAVLCADAIRREQAAYFVQHKRYAQAKEIRSLSERACAVAQGAGYLVQVRAIATEYEIVISRPGYLLVVQSNGDFTLDANGVKSRGKMKGAAEMSK